MRPLALRERRFTDSIPYEIASQNLSGSVDVLNSQSTVTPSRPQPRLRGENLP